MRVRDLQPENPAGTFRKVTRQDALSRWDKVAMKLDYAIGVVAPTWASRRSRSRARAALFAEAFVGARKDRLTSDWIPPRGDADSISIKEIPLLRDRSRDLLRGDPHGAALIQVLEDNVVGTGIVPQSNATPEGTGLEPGLVEEWNSAADLVFRDWAENEADATGHDSFFGLQRQVYRAWKVDGDTFVHPILLSGEPRTLSLALEIIEAERVDEPSKIGGKGGPKDKDVIERMRDRGGIEPGARGQAIAYWVFSANPQDPHRRGRGKWVRVRRFRDGRKNMLHVFRRDRTGQNRGVPALAPALRSFRDLGKYLESELVAARIASNIAYIVKRAGLGDDLLPGMTFAADFEKTGAHLEVIPGPGQIGHLDPGEEIEQLAINRPGTTFDPFVTRVLRAIAAALGLPYELLVRDFSKTNYSSMRAALLETRRGFGCAQLHLVTMFCRPVWQLVIREAILRGMMPRIPQLRRRLPALLRARWVPPAWGWVDPVKEITASLDAVDGGLSTLSEEAARNGNDWFDTARARARELVKLRDLETENDLPPGSLTRRGGAAAAAEPAATADDVARFVEEAVAQ